MPHKDPEAAKSYFKEHDKSKRPPRDKVQKAAYWKQYYQDHKKVLYKNKKKHPQSAEKKKEYALRHKFGISLEDYTQMVANQNGVCAICFRPETVRTKQGVIKQLGLDHNHKTDKLRELLCHDCNTAIGLMDEDVSRLLSAVSYLNKHKDL